MRSISSIFCVIILLASCKQNNDAALSKEKITASIKAYFEADTDKTNIIKVDSISIISIDTLTEKNSLKMVIDHKYLSLKGANDLCSSSVSLIKADSAFLASLQKQKALYDKHKEKYDDASLNGQIAKLHADSLQLVEDMLLVKNTTRSIDSLNKLYENADAKNLYEYYVMAMVYLHGAEGQQGSFIVSKDGKVRR